MRSSVIFFVFLIYCFGCSGSTQNVKQNQDVKKHIPVVEVYSSPSCSYCRDFWPVLQQLKRKYANNQVTFIDHHMVINPGDTKVLTAASCVEKQSIDESEKFYNIVYSSGLINVNCAFCGPSDEEIIDKIQAFGLGIDYQQFKTCAVNINSTITKEVNAKGDFNTQKYMIKAVPAVFVDGREIPDRNYDAIDKAIANALKVPQEVSQEISH